MRASSRFRFQDSGFAFQDSGFKCRFNLLKTSPFLQKFLLKKAFQYIENSFILQLRISAHNFPIESGRWKAIPKQNRICPLCMNNSIRDERHYLFHCTNGDLVDIRINFMKEFYKRNEIIDSGPLDTNNTIIKLLRGEYKIDYANIGKS